ncbi:16S rRNA (uracil(1498)-N(3))-methyltransferase [Serpentinicella alkaliphila]|uniref:Ribosomal RNA small subunit methyltransferase E n=1 Tax=Serpentinicella alkaliphila TaxID=1734049 RepID=A0A4R2TY17_9FIRM|nr:16S rRNA (uracil(1498)-N(3))-methyltransferase [Serpentinicella alkaliphila]QUH26913.1 16S rRNA (uracil(1498)-N(3))-methyltransferase [Serpentinicella alkaliphila]TCQ08146.1 16S rRNA (uracil1498-N3)-methyltransferase [Serpentinicella alkaliphila]
MNRFFVSPNQINRDKNEITIVDEDVKHISKVLRLYNGDEIEVSDGMEYVYIAEISDINKNEVLATIISSEKITTESNINITLFQSIPKSTKMDYIVQKATELGVKNIVPIISERTIVQFSNDKDAEKKRERWEKIVQEAAKQSKRGIVPNVEEPITFKKSIQRVNDYDLNLLAYEKESNIGLKKVIEKYSGVESIVNIGVWIGPEGGFDDKEISLLENIKVETITLGPRILRTETAGAALISALMYSLGDLGGTE